jgi:hypothetical protein
LPVALEPPVVESATKALERAANPDNISLAGDLAEADESRRAVAENIARIAFERFNEGKVDDPKQVRACYVRPAEAEVKLSEGVLGSKIKRIVKEGIKA